MQLSSENLLQLLTESDFEAKLAPKTAESPFSEIHLALGNQPLGKPLTLQIGIHEGPAPKPEKGDEELEALRLQFINFFVMFPIEMDEKAKGPTYQFLSALNAVIELPGFGVLENFKAPFFRYTLLCQKNEISEELFLMVMGLILYVIDTYAIVIQEVATGKTTLEDLSKNLG